MEQAPGSKKQVTFQEAMSAIEAAEQQARIEGAFDSEGDAFQELRQHLTSGRVTPQDAVEKAQGIIERRQNYH